MIALVRPNLHYLPAMVLHYVSFPVAGQSTHLCTTDSRPRNSEGAEVVVPAYYHMAARIQSDEPVEMAVAASASAEHCHMLLRVVVAAPIQSTRPDSNLHPMMPSLFYLLLLRLPTLFRRSAGFLLPLSLPLFHLLSAPSERTFHPLGWGMPRWHVRVRCSCRKVDLLYPYIRADLDKFGMGVQHHYMYYI